MSIMYLCVICNFMNAKIDSGDVTFLLMMHVKYVLYFKYDTSQQ